jgi:hypothetical protein
VALAENLCHSNSSGFDHHQLKASWKLGEPSVERKEEEISRFPAFLPRQTKSKLKPPTSSFFDEINPQTTPNPPINSPTNINSSHVNLQLPHISPSGQVPLRNSHHAHPRLSSSSGL